MPQRGRIDKLRKDAGAFWVGCAIATIEHQRGVNAQLLEAANELKQFGAPGTIGCWCNAGKPTHSPGCKAMRAAIRASHTDIKETTP